MKYTIKPHPTLKMLISNSDKVFFQIPVRTFDVTTQFTASGSEQTKSVIVCGTESLTKFTDGFTNIIQCFNHSSFGVNVVSGGGFESWIIKTIDSTEC